MMKKIIAMMLMMSAGIVSAGVSDTVFAFSTSGVDRYADGRPVADGECYALVWADEGHDFKGFLADGTLADAENNRTVLVAPVARKGRCPKTVVQIDEGFVRELGRGSFAVVLLDTRVVSSDGSVRLAAIGEDGMPESVAAMTVMDASVAVDDGFAEAKIADAAVASTAAVSPVSAPVPAITGFSVRDGIASVTFGNVVPYARYNVKGGATPAEIDGAVFSYDFNGEPDADGEMTVNFAVEKAANCRFFRIVRR